MVIPLDVPFRLLVHSLAVGRVRTVPALERPSAGLPAPIRVFGFPDRPPARCQLLI